jgi:7-cyano-7-deazaguanine reductase
MRFELQRAAMPSQPSEHIETFPNPAPEHDYTIHMHMPEFTCLCPRTGQPDFATLELEYVPDRLCVELKSLKLYVWSFRNRPAFHEAVANEIIDHLARAVAPRFMRLNAHFNVRGGIGTRISVERRAARWQGKIPAPFGPAA